MDNKHTDKEFEAELNSIKTLVMRMGGMLISMLNAAMDAFKRHDANSAASVIVSDNEVDRLELEVDELCLSVLARRQPLGSDLRFVTTAMKLVTDMERIGDLCVNIAERTSELAQEPVSVELEDITAMSLAVKEMLTRAVKAFSESDPTEARAVIEADRAIDVRYVQAQRQLLNLMAADKVRISMATRLQSIAKYLERAGDHVVNLAEMAIFMAQGRDIRHSARRTDNSVRGVLFLCVHNSAASQMAEGWARLIFPAGTHVWSAGSDPAENIHPLAVEVMHEVGIDISGQRPKRISDIPLSLVGAVITLCAKEPCINLSGISHHETWSLPDLTAQADTNLETFRQVRDELKARITELTGRLESVLNIE